MTDLERRFCPRCGTSLVPGMRFCPGCGLDTSVVGGVTEPPASVRADQPTEASGPLPDSGGEATSSRQPAASAERLRVPSALHSFSRLFDKGSPGPSMVLSALIIGIGLVIFALLMRPQAASPVGPPQAAQPGTSGAVVQPGSSGAPPAPIVELSFQSPVDRQAVATKDITVIGIGPPGLTVTRDVSFGLDQHATIDGTGHWAMSVGLGNGDNQLVFRIGDDRSTEKKLHVTYQPPPQ
jgi:hypothetical protein